MIKTKEDLAYYKQQDAIANGYSGHLKWNSLRGHFNKTKRFLTLLRETEYYKNNPSPINKLFYLYKSYRLNQVAFSMGYSIPVNVFGPGLSLPHYGTIVVNGATKVGAFCRLHCCTNIGASGGNKEAPSIGDNVYIGPGAILFGNIKMASNITIGANATVNQSFEEEHIAIAGKPAKIVKRDMPNWIEFNKL